MAVRAFLIRRAAGHERPLDGSFWGLCEGKGPCDLERTYTVVINAYSLTFGFPSIMYTHARAHTDGNSGLGLLEFLNEFLHVAKI